MTETEKTIKINKIINVYSFKKREAFNKNIEKYKILFDDLVNDLLDFVSKTEYGQVFYKNYKIDNEEITENISRSLEEYVRDLLSPLDCVVFIRKQEDPDYFRTGISEKNKIAYLGLCITILM